MTIKVVKVRATNGARRPDELRSLAIPALQQRILAAMNRGDAGELEELRAEYRSRSVVRVGRSIKRAARWPFGAVSRAATVTVLVATQTFWTTVNGQPFLVSVGQRFYSDHPVVVANASLLQPARLVDVPDPPP